MISFSNFKTAKKKYVSLDLSLESQSKLNLWCRMNGFDVSTNHSGEPIDCINFHLTVMYTKNEVSFENFIKVLKTPIDIDFERIDLFGENFDVPVLIVKKNYDLRKLWKFFEKQGFEDTWDKWAPHVTVSYNYAFHVNLNELTLPKFKVSANVLKVEDQK